MSFTITIDIFCDMCPNWVHGEDTASTRIEKRRALACAKRQGWLITGENHYCPDCRKLVEHKQQTV